MGNDVACSQFNEQVLATTYSPTLFTPAITRNSQGGARYFLGEYPPILKSILKFFEKIYITIICGLIVTIWSKSLKMYKKEIIYEKSFGFREIRVAPWFLVSYLYLNFQGFYRQPKCNIILDS